MARSHDTQPTVWVIYGSDGFSVQERSAAVVNALCGGQSHVVERIEGEGEGAETPAETARRVLEAVRTPGLFGGRRVVWLRGADFLLTAAGEADSAAWARRLAEEIKRGLPPGVSLVLSGSRADQRSVLLRACRDAGRVINADKATRPRDREEEARRTATELLRREGLKADPEALAELVQRTGGEPGLLHQEIRKLAAYRQGSGRLVQVADVRRLVPAVREAVRWEFADAVSSGEARRALEVLQRLLSQRQEVVGLLAGLEHRFRELSLLRACLDRGWLRVRARGYRVDADWTDAEDADRWLAQLPDDPRQMHPYRVAMRAREARRFTTAELLEIRRRILQVHLQVVGGAARPDLLLEFLVLDIARRGRPAAADSA